MTRSRRLDRSDLWDAALVGVVMVLVATAMLVGRWLESGEDRVHAGAPPLQGVWEPRWSWWGLGALLLAVLVVAFGPRVASTVNLRVLPWLTWLVSTGWLLAVASADRGLAAIGEPLRSRYDYLAAVPGVDGWNDLLAGFTERIPIDAPDAWPTHVSGHPPGALAPFVALDRLGLEGAGPAAALLVVVGASAAAALVVVARALAGESAARRLAPFAGLYPGAVWMAVSGDALILGVSAWGVALVAIACVHQDQRVGLLAAASGGLLLGGALYLSYGMVLIVGIAVAVLVTRGSWLLVASTVAGVMVVVASFSLAGFSWWTGYDLVVERYRDGLGGQRLYAYWVWANLAAFLIAIGPAAVVGLRRMLAAVEVPRGFSRQRWWTWVRDPRNAVAVVAMTGLAVAVVATVGGLSKGEVERIWLPFGSWLLLAAVAIPESRARWWLAAQAAVVLAVQHLVLTPW